MNTTAYFRALTDLDISHAAEMFTDFVNRLPLSSHYRKILRDITLRSTDSAYRISRRSSAGLRIDANADIFNLEFVPGIPTMSAYLLDRDTREVELTHDPDLILGELPGILRRANLVRLRGGFDYFGWDEVAGVRGGPQIFRSKVEPIRDSSYVSCASNNA